MSEKRSTLLLVMPPQFGLLNGFAAGLISLANFAVARSPGLSVEILDLSGHALDRAARQVARSVRRFKNENLFVGITTTTGGWHCWLVQQCVPGAS